jgi:S-adenosyl methyltransferase
VRIDRIIGIYSDPGHVFVYSDGEVRQEFNICLAAMHFIPGADHPQAIVHRYIDALAPGSYLVLSHAAMLAADPDTAEAAREYASSSAGSFIIRTPEEVAAFFDGLDLLEPGLVDAGRWRTTQAEPIEPGFLAGVGRKR